MTPRGRPRASLLLLLLLFGLSCLAWAQDVPEPGREGHDEPPSDEIKAACQKAFDDSNAKDPVFIEIFRGEGNEHCSHSIMKGLISQYVGIEVNATIKASDHPKFVVVAKNVDCWIHDKDHKEKSTKFRGDSVTPFTGEAGEITYHCEPACKDGEREKFEQHPGSVFTEAKGCDPAVTIEPASANKEHFCKPIDLPDKTNWVHVTNGHTCTLSNVNIPKKHVVDGQRELAYGFNYIPYDTLVHPSRKDTQKPTIRCFETTATEPTCNDDACRHMLPQGGYIGFYSSELGKCSKKEWEKNELNFAGPIEIFEAKDKYPKGLHVVVSDKVECDVNDGNGDTWEHLDHDTLKDFPDVPAGKIFKVKCQLMTRTGDQKKCDDDVLLKDSVVAVFSKGDVDCDPDIKFSADDTLCQPQEFDLEQEWLFVRNEWECDVYTKSTDEWKTVSPGLYLFKPKYFQPPVSEYKDHIKIRCRGPEAHSGKDCQVEDEEQKKKLCMSMVDKDDIVTLLSSKSEKSICDKVELATGIPLTGPLIEWTAKDAMNDLHVVTSEVQNCWLLRNGKEAHPIPPGSLHHIEEVTADEKLTFHCLPKERGTKRHCDGLDNHDDKDKHAVFFLDPTNEECEPIEKLGLKVLCRHGDEVTEVKRLIVVRHGYTCSLLHGDFKIPGIATEGQSPDIYQLPSGVIFDTHPEELDEIRRVKCTHATNKCPLEEEEDDNVGDPDTGTGETVKPGPGPGTEPTPGPGPVPDKNFTSNETVVTEKNTPPPRPLTNPTTKSRGGPPPGVSSGVEVKPPSRGDSPSDSKPPAVTPPSGVSPPGNPSDNNLTLPPSPPEPPVKKPDAGAEEESSTEGVARSLTVASLAVALTAFVFRLESF